MWHARRVGPDSQTLELAAQSAGSAWACAFASSAEYEAATIQAKRAAGVYGPKRLRRQLFVTIVVVTVLALCLIPLF